MTEQSKTNVPTTPAATDDGAFWILHNYQLFVLSRFKQLNVPTDDLLHAAVGVAGEGGEMLDCIKKTWAYGKPFERANYIEEMGDALFYIQAGCNLMGMSLLDLIQINTAKLEKRYPAGYSDAAAIARADKE